MVTLWIEDRFLWKSSSLCLHLSACLHQVNIRSFFISLSCFIIYIFWYMMNLLNLLSLNHLIRYLM
jgi:hypothetical protein